MKSERRNALIQSIASTLLIDIQENIEDKRFTISDYNVARKLLKDAINKLASAIYHGDNSPQTLAQLQYHQRLLTMVNLMFSQQFDTPRE